MSVVLSNVQTTIPPGQPGQAILGSPSTATLTIQDIDPNYAPLAVTNVQWTGTVQDIRQIFVTFNKPLIASTADNPANYALVDVGKDGKFGTLDDQGVPLNAPAYTSSIYTVTLTPTQPLRANEFFHLWINGSAPGGIEDLGSNMLTGNGTTAGTSYTALLARGTSLRYYTPSGDQVNLKITGGGIIDDLLDGSGQGIKLSVVGEVPHHTVLSGNVKKSRNGSGRAYLGSTVWGLGQFGDVRVKMYSPPFQVGQYPFSPGSASLKTTGSLISLEALVFNLAQTGGGSKATGHVHAQGVAKPMIRPFHSVRR